MSSKYIVDANNTRWLLKLSLPVLHGHDNSTDFKDSPLKQWFNEGAICYLKEMQELVRLLLFWYWFSY